MRAIDSTVSREIYTVVKARLIAGELSMRAIDSTVSREIYTVVQARLIA